MAQCSGVTATRMKRLIVTRPAQEAAVWVQALRTQGWPAHALPLIEVGEPQEPGILAALHQWRERWLQLDAIMFVSAAAVKSFFQAGVAAHSGGEVHTRFWAPGPGTAQALIRALGLLGVGEQQIDAPPADAVQFDSETLWPVVAAQVRPGCRVLIVRGQSGAGADEPARFGQVAGSGRNWLIQQCTAAGAEVNGCVAYVRRSPKFSEADQQLAQAASEAGSVWLLSSSEAVDHLHALAPASGWARAGALVTHPRIGEAARAAGFGQVMECRPALADVLSALESHWSQT